MNKKKAKTIVELSPEFKAELDRRVDEYLSGGKMVSAIEMKKRIQVLQKKRKK